MVFQRILIASKNTALKTVFSRCHTQIKIRLIHTSPYYAFAERLFTDKHEWVEIEGETGKIGISHYAQETLGDVVYAQLPEVDTVLDQKAECGALESVKAASEIYSPISGKVIAKNEEIEKTPSLINSSCYDKGWLFKVKVSNQEELKNLMSEDQYKEFLKTEEH